MGILGGPKLTQECIYIWVYIYIYLYTAFSGGIGARRACARTCVACVRAGVCVCVCVSVCVCLCVCCGGPFDMSEDFLCFSWLGVWQCSGWLTRKLVLLRIASCKKWTTQHRQTADKWTSGQTNGRPEFLLSPDPLPPMGDYISQPATPRPPTLSKILCAFLRLDSQVAPDFWATLCWPENAANWRTREKQVRGFKGTDLHVRGCLKQMLWGRQHNPTDVVELEHFCVRGHWSRSW